MDGQQPENIVHPAPNDSRGAKTRKREETDEREKSENRSTEAVCESSRVHSEKQWSNWKATSNVPGGR